MSDILLSITAAARELNISPSLLRYAEQRGAVPPARRVAGLNRRVYTEDDLALLKAWREGVQYARKGDHAT